ncbi:hypothetical protein BMETH_2330_0 [methanotrophic bacterial endosymbiont of Bathymodiolus sp.]|nr:hypothetical protein BMETH_2330_0 [methanotrophic bacterial endosymbiont of Bathymodiolus sp.]
MFSAADEYTVIGKLRGLNVGLISYWLAAANAIRRSPAGFRSMIFAANCIVLAAMEIPGSNISSGPFCSG